MNQRPQHLVPIQEVLDHMGHENHAVDLVRNRLEFEASEIQFEELVHRREVGRVIVVAAIAIYARIVASVT